MSHLRRHVLSRATRSGLRKRSNASHVVPYIGLQVMRAARRSTKAPARALPAAVPTGTVVRRADVLGIACTICATVAPDAGPHRGRSTPRAHLTARFSAQISRPQPAKPQVNIRSRSVIVGQVRSHVANDHRWTSQRKIMYAAAKKTWALPPTKAGNPGKQRRHDDHPRHL